MTTNNSIEISSLNCQSCGLEYETDDLETVKLAGFKGKILLCKNCKEKAPIELFKDASELLNDIVRISQMPTNHSKRLQLIEDLFKK